MYDVSICIIYITCSTYFQCVVGLVSASVFEEFLICVVPMIIHFVSEMCLQQKN